MIKKIIYIINFISLLLLTFLTIGMLPIIFQTSWQGLLLLFMIILLLVVEIFIIIKNGKKKDILDNIYIIFATIYFSIFYYKIYNNFTSFNYDIKIGYCKQNFLMISLFLFLIIINALEIKKFNYKNKSK